MPTPVRSDTGQLSVIERHTEIGHARIEKRPLVAGPFCGEVFVEGMQGEVGLRHQEGRCQRSMDNVHF